MKQLLRYLLSTFQWCASYQIYFLKVPYKDLKEALDATKRGEIWGVIHFGQNFTDELVVRQGDGSAAQNETILASRINVYLDYSGKLLTWCSGKSWQYIVSFKPQIAKFPWLWSDNWRRLLKTSAKTYCQLVHTNL